MTLKTKNIVLNATSVFNFISAILFIVLFSFHKEIRGTEQYILLINSVVVVVTTIFIYLFFKKSLPSEIIFLAVFMTSFSMQGVRILDFLINFETFMISILIGRISIFFKYMGLLALLGASLFTYSIKKQKIGSWLMLSMAASGIIATIIHFNTGIVNNNLLPKIIFNREEEVITIALIIITVATLIKSGLDSKNRYYFILALSVLFISLSFTLSFISLNLFSGVIIILLLISGLAGYLSSMHNITLWG